MNEGTALPIEKFLNQYESFAQELKPIMETIAFVKDKPQVEVIPEWKKDRAFTKVRNKLLALEKKEQLREGIERGIAPLPLDKRYDFLILLLNSMKKIWGITKIFKLLFLMKEEENLDTYVPDYYVHYAYDYGPFEKEIYKDIEVLKQSGLIEEKKPPRKRNDVDEEIDEGLYLEKVDAIYRLTDRGIKIARALEKSAQEKDPAILQKIEKIKSKYGSLSLRSLLKYIYKQYPEYAEKSKIKKEILDMDDNND